MKNNTKYPGVELVPVNPENLEEGFWVFVEIPLIGVEGNYPIAKDNTCKTFTVLESFFDMLADSINPEVIRFNIVHDSVKRLKGDIDNYLLFDKLNQSDNDSKPLKSLSHKLAIKLAELSIIEKKIKNVSGAWSHPLSNALKNAFQGEGIILDLNHPHYPRYMKNSNDSFVVREDSNLRKNLTVGLADFRVKASPKFEKAKKDRDNLCEKISETASTLLKDYERKKTHLINITSESSTKLQSIDKFLILLQAYAISFLQHTQENEHEKSLSEEKIQLLRGVISIICLDILSDYMSKERDLVRELSDRITHLVLKQVECQFNVNNTVKRPRRHQIQLEYTSILDENSSETLKQLYESFNRRQLVEFFTDDNNTDIALDDCDTHIKKTSWYQDWCKDPNADYAFLDHDQAKGEYGTDTSVAGRQINKLKASNGDHWNLWIQFFFGCLNQYVLAVANTDDPIGYSSPLNMGDRLNTSDRMIPALMRKLLASPLEGSEVVLKLIEFVQENYKALGLKHALSQNHIDHIIASYKERANLILRGPYFDEFLLLFRTENSRYVINYDGHRVSLESEDFCDAMNWIKKGPDAGFLSDKQKKARVSIETYQDQLFNLKKINWEKMDEASITTLIRCDLLWRALKQKKESEQAESSAIDSSKIESTNWLEDKACVLHLALNANLSPEILKMIIGQLVIHIDNCIEEFLTNDGNTGQIDSFEKSERIEESLLRIMRENPLLLVPLIQKWITDYRSNQESIIKQYVSKKRHYALLFEPFIQIANAENEMVLGINKSQYDSLKKNMALFAYQLLLDLPHTHLFNFYMHMCQSAKQAFLYHCDKLEEFIHLIKHIKNNEVMEMGFLEFAKSKNPDFLKDSVINIKTSELGSVPTGILSKLLIIVIDKNPELITSEEYSKSPIFHDLFRRLQRTSIGPDCKNLVDLFCSIKKNDANAPIDFDDQGKSLLSCLVNNYKFTAAGYFLEHYFDHKNDVALFEKYVQNIVQSIDNICDHATNNLRYLFLMLIRQVDKLSQPTKSLLLNSLFEQLINLPNFTYALDMLYVYVKEFPNLYQSIPEDKIDACLKYLCGTYAVEYAGKNFERSKILLTEFKKHSPSSFTPKPLTNLIEVALEQKDIELVSFMIDNFLNDDDITLYLDTKGEPLLKLIASAKLHDVYQNQIRFMIVDCLFKKYPKNNASKLMLLHWMIEAENYQFLNSFLCRCGKDYKDVLMHQNDKEQTPLQHLLSMSPLDNTHVLEQYKKNIDVLMALDKHRAAEILPWALDHSNLRSISYLMEGLDKENLKILTEKDQKGEVPLVGLFTQEHRYYIKHFNHSTLNIEIITRFFSTLLEVRPDVLNTLLDHNSSLLHYIMSLEKDMIAFALFIACVKDNVLNYGCMLEAIVRQDNKGNTPLHYFFAGAFPTFCASMLDKLACSIFEYYQDRPATQDSKNPFSIKNANGMTPIDQLVDAIENSEGSRYDALHEKHFLEKFFTKTTPDAKQSALACMSPKQQLYFLYYSIQQSDFSTAYDIYNTLNAAQRKKFADDYDYLSKPGLGSSDLDTYWFCGGAGFSGVLEFDKSSQSSTACVQFLLDDLSLDDTRTIIRKRYLHNEPGEINGDNNNRMINIYEYMNSHSKYKDIVEQYKHLQNKKLSYYKKENRVAIAWGLSLTVYLCFGILIVGSAISFGIGVGIAFGLTLIICGIAEGIRRSLNARENKILGPALEKIHAKRTLTGKEASEANESSKKGLQDSLTDSEVVPSEKSSRNLFHPHKAAPKDSKGQNVIQGQNIIHR